MSELETEYEGQITFSIIPTAGRENELDLERYDVGNHGLVALDADGEVVESIPGHNLEREQIAAICERLTD